MFYLIYIFSLNIIPFDIILITWITFNLLQYFVCWRVINEGLMPEHSLESNC